MYKLLLVSILASSAVWVATSVHRQPFVPLHLCNDSHLCRCIVQRLCVAVFMHPCITALCDRYRASLHDPQVAGSRTRRTKNNTPLIELAKVWRGCRIVLALLVSHRAKLWASTITHPCVCGRLGRCIVQRLCATAIVHPCTTRTVRVRPPAPKKAGLCLFRHSPAFLVPMAGVEPARYCYQRILSPSRLPIPSHRLIKMCCKTALHNGNSDFTV